jgi:hypothetical protein
MHRFFRSTAPGSLIASRTFSARVNDGAHQYGGLGNGGFVKGDMNVFGRVYMSTPGRGVPYGTPSR